MKYILTIGALAGLLPADPLMAQPAPDTTITVRAGSALEFDPATISVKQGTRVRLRLGPLTRGQYDQFLPNGSAFEPLQTLTRFFSGDQLDFEVQLQLARDEVPGCALGVDGLGSPLGWCTWMRSQEFARDPDDTILTL